MRIFINTWTIFVLICILQHSQSRVVPEPHEPEPATMLEAIVKKCPNLNTTELELDQTSNETFTKTCTNWTSITQAFDLKKSQPTEVRCLMLYESVALFCTQLKDNLTKGLVSSLANKTTYSVDTVCESTNSISGKLSQFNQTTCVLACGKLGVEEAYDTCNLAYHFASFNVTAYISFREHLANVNSGDNVHDSPVYSHSGVSSAAPLVSAAPVESSNNPARDAHLANQLQHQESSSSNQHSQAEKPVDENVAVQSAVKNENVSPAVTSKPVNRLSSTANADVSPTKDPRTGQKLSSTAKYVDLNDGQEQPDNENDGWGQNSDVGLDGNDADIGGAENEIQVPQDSSKDTASHGAESPLVDSDIDDRPVEELDGDSYFFSYFSVLMCLCIVGYVGYHNKQKIFALLLEGKRGKKTGKRGRRPNSANYHKLDNNLEEAISSSVTRSATNVIY